ncbi:hypothetical protein EYF80_032278 [Liparis tanakae]|uniref:Uncharacterized protein n=1 Tax=Liparis tanakae TaxID=230148 RepID=A0A4Z2GXX5_9TELE|nr:hypothetical protein EYF80_032278 [Liparis tanakae]
MTLKEKRSSEAARPKQLETTVQMFEEPETTRQTQSTSFDKSTWTHCAETPPYSSSCSSGDHFALPLSATHHTAAGEGLAPPVGYGEHRTGLKTLELGFKRMQTRDDSTGSEVHPPVEQRSIPLATDKEACEVSVCRRDALRLSMTECTVELIVLSRTSTSI